jgi:hypothetical protein
MGKEITAISPEGLEVANSYLQFGNIKAVSNELRIPEDKIANLLSKRDVKKYIDTVYLDMGYRNRNNIAGVLDEMIARRSTGKWGILWKRLSRLVKYGA